MSGGEKVVIADKPLVCSHCQRMLFEVRFAFPDVGTRVWNWRHKLKICTCVNCGNTYFFEPAYMEKPRPPMSTEHYNRLVEMQSEHTEEAPLISDLADDTAYESTCLSCGAKIPAKASNCPECGWSYMG